MGTDPAPFMANLYLYSYEFKWMEDLTKTAYGIARRFYGNTNRFIDDLCTLNNGHQIAKNWKKIYPKELVLNKENIEDKEATFLDLVITVEDNKFHTKIYDKRDAFSFQIVSLPDLRGNIAEGPAYGVLKGQVIRFARNSSKFTDFSSRITMMVNKVANKGYEIEKIIKSTRNCILRHGWILEKFSELDMRMIRQLFL